MIRIMIIVQHFLTSITSVIQLVCKNDMCTFYNSYRCKTDAWPVCVSFMVASLGGRVGLTEMCFHSVYGNIAVIVSKSHTHDVPYAKPQTMQQ